MVLDEVHADISMLLIGPGVVNYPCYYPHVNKASNLAACSSSPHLLVTPP